MGQYNITLYSMYLTVLKKDVAMDNSTLEYKPISTYLYNDWINNRINCLYLYRC